MFNEVGKELKSIARSYVKSKTILAVICGIAITIVTTMLVGGAGFVIGAIAGGIIVAVVYSNARMEAIRTYAYGELVDCVMSIENQLAGRNKKTVKSVTVKGEDSAPPSPQPSGTPWKCPVCDHVNQGSSLYCGKCSHVR